MISYNQGDLFASAALARVNPVNTAGVMGAGLAKQFADRHPEMLSAYQAACRQGQLTKGCVHRYNAADGHLVINLPT